MNKFFGSSFSHTMTTTYLSQSTLSRNPVPSAARHAEAGPSRLPGARLRWRWPVPARCAWRRCWLPVLVLGLVALGVVGCQTYSPSAFAPLEVKDLRALSYSTNVVQEGDTLAITFQYSTNYNSTQKVTLDGMLSLDQVGQVKAAGSTVAHLQTELTRLYQPYAKQDYITVKLVLAATSVYITGAVVKPGKFVMERPMTALEAIMEAGGFDPYRAKLSRVVVLRLENGGQRSYRLNLKHALRGEEENPFYLKPFDIVHVPTKTFNF